MTKGCCFAAQVGVSFEFDRILVPVELLLFTCRPARTRSTLIPLVQGLALPHINCEVSVLVLEVITQDQNERPA